MSLTPLLQRPEEHSSVLALVDCSLKSRTHLKRGSTYGRNDHLKVAVKVTANVRRTSSCVWMFSFFLQPQLQLTYFVCADIFKLAAILLIQYFCYCQNNLAGYSFVFPSWAAQISADLLLRVNSPAATSAHVYLRGDVGVDHERRQLCQIQLRSLCLFSSLSPYSCYLLIVIATIKACLCSLGGFQSSDSRRQNRFNTF